MAPEAVDSFGRLEAERKSLYRTHAAVVKVDEKVHRAVRLKKGEQPDFAGLTPLQVTAWRMFKDRVRGNPDPLLAEELPRAHMRIRADEYLAYVMFLQWVVLLPAGLALAGVIILLLGVLGGLNIFIPIAIGAVLVLIMFFVLPMILRSAPHSRAKSRGKKIDVKISAAMSFVSAMASADVNIDAIFKELGQQKIYGQVAEEAAWITRDTELLGIDILTAIKQGANRTPSKRFQDFLQGVVTTATSGGLLKPYFLLKAEQYERENKLDLLKRVESMGLLAEVFVTTIVAFPLFLVIMLAIFAIVGNYGAQVLTFLWAIIGLMIPLGQFAFVTLMYLAANEGK
ncbi:MAG: type II secretion system F family protein [Euryarchaeota archaeon]|nr:type II secretion system F family protein [Euryarchaeota archaeon]MDE1836808.1 type II secretion system F family protein [Euryarchaeota archaeon]MDE1881124.1 type II secretion system F family protein [Euryarchaeota archaeon]MDE2044792.1 type II secretion system F family protein [Thermoplasmata archaeon]